LIQETLIKKLEDLISASFADKNIEFIDFNYRYVGKSLILSILADKPQGGITLGECALLNRQLGILLEEKNIIGGDYTLEVSSPGLDRPLKTQKDFQRCLNKEAVFYFNEPLGGKYQWQGVIGRVDEERVFIHNAGEIFEVPLIKINKAQLVI